MVMDLLCPGTPSKLTACLTTGRSSTASSSWEDVVDGGAGRETVEALSAERVEADRPAPGLATAVRAFGGDDTSPVLNADAFVDRGATFGGAVEATAMDSRRL